MKSREEKHSYASKAKAGNHLSLMFVLSFFISLIEGGISSARADSGNNHHPLPGHKLEFREKRDFSAVPVMKNGMIEANINQIRTDHGNASSVDLYGDKLVSFVVSENVMKKLKQAPAGLSQDKVNVTGAQMREVIGHVVNTGQRTAATKAYRQNGRIVLTGGAFRSGSTKKMIASFNSKAKAPMVLARSF